MQFLHSSEDHAVMSSKAGLSAIPGSPSTYYTPVLGLTPEIIRDQNLSAALEIHDLITQKLFSASLIAEVLPRLLEVNPSEGRLRLSELRELTQEAMLEMQYLLVELRDSDNFLKLEMEGKNAKGGAGPE